MVNSMVGHLLIGITFIKLCEERIKGGMTMVKVRYMGGNAVLLTPRDGEQMEEIIKGNKEWLTVLWRSLSRGRMVL